MKADIEGWFTDIPTHACLHSVNCLCTSLSTVLSFAAIVDFANLIRLSNHACMHAHKSHRIWMRHLVCQAFSEGGMHLSSSTKRMIIHLQQRPHIFPLFLIKNVSTQCSDRTLLQRRSHSPTHSQTRE